MKYMNVLSKALVQNEPQWCDYTVMGETFVVLVERIPGKESFVAHEAPYEGCIHDIMLKLTQALNNFRKIQDN